MAILARNAIGIRGNYCSIYFVLPLQISLSSDVTLRDYYDRVNDYKMYAGLASVCMYLSPVDGISVFGIICLNKAKDSIPDICLPVEYAAWDVYIMMAMPRCD